ncbi:MAG: radical SAM protein [Candidatus Omnitrophota bacterium]
MLKAAQKELQIFLTDRCQLSCRYCYLDRRAKKDLSWPLVKKAVTDFLDGASAPRVVSFYGGEPLLSFPLFKRTVEFIRRDHSPADVFLYLATNGIRVDRKVAAFCAAQAVTVLLSFDGRRDRHDGQRCGAVESSYDAARSALKHLQKARVPVIANMVIRPQDASSWVDDLKHVVGCGFTQVQLLPDAAAIWSTVEINRFARSQRDFVRMNIDHFTRKGASVFTVEQVRRLISLRDNRGACGCNKRILSADGKYYACDKALACSSDGRQPYATGDALAGFDADGRRKIIGRLDRRVKAAERGRRCAACRWREVCFCPLGLPVLSGVDPDLGQRWNSFCRISDLLLTSCRQIVLKLKDEPRFCRAYQLRPDAPA